MALFWIILVWLLISMILNSFLYGAIVTIIAIIIGVLYCYYTTPKDAIDTDYEQYDITYNKEDDKNK